MNELIKAVDRAVRFYQDELEAMGHCDHEVNICCCSIIRELEDLKNALKHARAREVLVEKVIEAARLYRRSGSIDSSELIFSALANLEQFDSLGKEE